MGYVPDDYVWVHERLQKFHDKYKKGQITTEFTTVWDIISFKATVVIDVTVDIEKRQHFTWSSLWDIKKEKAFEKLETVAVWRALANAWFEIQSWIASKDEIDRFTSNNWERHTCVKCNKEVKVVPFKWKYGMCFRCPECKEFSKTNPILDWEDLSKQDF